MSCRCHCRGLLCCSLRVTAVVVPGVSIFSTADSLHKVVTRNTIFSRSLPPCLKLDIRLYSPNLSLFPRNTPADDASWVSAATALTSTLFSVKDFLSVLQSELFSLYSLFLPLALFSDPLFLSFLALRLLSYRQHVSTPYGRVFWASIYFTGLLPSQKRALAVVIM